MIRQRGKKGLEWQRERIKILKQLGKTGKYVIVKSLLYGNCKDCGRYKCLDLDHVEGRHGENPHALTNLDPICRICHIKRHNLNHMPQKEQKTDKSKAKPNWQKDHICKNCKETISLLLCPHCGKISV